MARRSDQPATDNAARERILDAAEELFAGTGFDATPTAKIAAAAGTPKGLLFYYFPKKINILTTLFAERMPVAPLCDVDRVARHGDVVGSLRRLARGLDLGRHESVLLRTVLMREVDTHPEVRGHLRRLTDGLVELTESVLDAAAASPPDARRRRDAARTFVAVMLFDANNRRFDGRQPDLAAAARVVAAGLTGG
ncbi:TetR/AcrR family transcriptional regulator [Microlunatus speluncae]|uniref:TetR/AcrR family transcriptional regulator n=1 Tax=Microlunatus speluncae TaxID=2594267 RepID=UPI00126626BF|nr:TetR/AcrR family transcriptional regulator [Microlunatus speluncae]